MVCSEHFVDGKPTLENPNPTLGLGNKNVFKKARRVLVHRSRDATIEAEDLEMACATTCNETLMDVLPEEVTVPSSCTSCDATQSELDLLKKEVAQLMLENSKIARRAEELANTI